MNEYYTIKGARIVLEHENGKAVLVSAEDHYNDIWIPVSQIHENSEVVDINSPEGDLLVLYSFAEFRKWV